LQILDESSDLGTEDSGALIQFVEVGLAAVATIEDTVVDGSAISAASSVGVTPPSRRMAL